MLFLLTAGSRGEQTAIEHSSIIGSFSLFASYRRTSPYVILLKVVRVRTVPPDQSCTGSTLKY